MYFCFILPYNNQIKMNRKLEILHVANIISFLLFVAYIYIGQHQVLISIMLGLEICVFILGLISALRLRNHGEDMDRKRLFRKSWWLTLFSLLFIGIYFFINHR